MTMHTLAIFTLQCPYLELQSLRPVNVEVGDPLILNMHLLIHFNVELT